MKKYLTILCICLCSVCAHAQYGWVRGLFFKRTAAKSRVTARTIEKSLQQQAVVPPRETLLQIHNLPEQPLIKLKPSTPADELFAQSGVSVSRSILPARALASTLAKAVIFPKGADPSAIFIPTALNTQEKAVYRGLKINNLQELQNILENGLEANNVSVSTDGKIYFSASLYTETLAATKSTFTTQLPIVVKFIPPAEQDCYVHAGNYYTPKDIPPQDIRAVMVFLEANGTPGWYQAVLDDGKIVLLPAQSRVFAPDELLEYKLNIPETRAVRITNMPGEPLVKLGGSGAETSAVLLGRMLPGGDSDYLIHPVNPNGSYTGNCFMPQDILENEKSFYRAMRLANIEDLRNLLINGLEANKTYYNGEIYASLKLSVILFYLTRGNQAQLPVLVKIPATETLRSYAPEAFPTQDRYAPKAFQTGEQAVFRRDIPTRFISDVWIFLEVGGKPDWYKVILEKDELVFIPALGKMINYSE